VVVLVEPVEPALDGVAAVAWWVLEPTRRVGSSLGGRRIRAAHFLAIRGITVVANRRPT
jgi:hypothetical protein